MVIRRNRPPALPCNVRIPYWADAASVTVNGVSFQSNQSLQPSSYAKIDRTWKNGDLVEVKLPMRLHLQAIPDDPTLVAIMYGPLVLAGALAPRISIRSEFIPTTKFCTAVFPPLPCQSSPAIASALTNGFNRSPRPAARMM